MAQSFSAGFNSGLSFSEIKYDGENKDDIIHSNYKMGFTGGVQVNLTLLKKIAIRSELNFARQGEEYRKLYVHTPDGIQLTDGSAKTNLDYIHLPVLIEISGGKCTQWFFNAGVSYARLIKAENVFSPEFAQYEDLEVIDRYYKDDTLLVVGGGAKFKINSLFNIHIEFRHYRGQNRIQKNITHANAETRSYSSTVGVNYLFGKQGNE